MIILEMIFGLLVVAGLVGVLVLPILALVRTRRIGDLRERVERLEYEVGRLRRAARAAPPPVTPAHDEVVQVERPAPVAEEPLEALPVAEELRSPAERRRESVRKRDAAALESWVGQNALGWAAVVLLLFATAFFLKYAFDNNWIGELGRVSLGLVAGAALCGAGLVAHRRGRQVTSQMLSAAGVALLYLATFAAFGYYHILPRDRAAIFLIAVVIEAAALAVLYDAPGIAVMAVVGGLLSPVLLRSDHDRYVSLFFYLTVLDAGVVGLALFRGGARRRLQGLLWRFLAPIALLGTQGLFWIWHLERYHPAKLEAALLFQGVVFALFLGHDLIAPLVRRRRTHPIQMVQLLVNAFFFSLAGYVLLREDYHLWLPAGALGLAIVYAALGFFLQRRLPDDAWLQLSAAAAGFSFIAVAVALRGEAAWISLGWAVEGAALWWFGLRIRAEPMRWFGAALLLMAVGRLLMVDTPWLGRDHFVPIVNRYALPALAVSACVLAAAWASRRLPRRSELDWAAWWLLGLAGVLLVWLILSLETYQFLILPHGPRWAEWEDRRRLAQAGLSVFWAVYAGVVLAVGFWQHSRPLRVTALGLFGLTLGKVVLVDMAGLGEFYRVLAFFVLAVVMGAAAWAYQRMEAGRRLGS